MATYLITWNPKKFEWEDLPTVAERVWRRERILDTWSAANQKIRLGDRLFLLRQGVEPRGIVASGRATSQVKHKPHYDPEQAAQGKTHQCVELQWEALLIPDPERILPRERLDEPDLSNVHWDSQVSGIVIPKAEAGRLEALWEDHLAKIGYGRKPAEVKRVERAPVSEKFIRVFDDLGITYKLKKSGAIDNNHVLKYEGDTLQLYFHDVTPKRGAFIAAHPDIYTGFDWALWQSVAVPRRTNYLKKMPLDGQEREAFQRLLMFLKGSG